jgi:two-component system nitrate/nitrite response regulator NarL
VTGTARRPASQQIEVLVADAQPLYRDAVARVVRQDGALALVAELDDGRPALDAIRAFAPRVAVLDARLPGLGGPRVAAAVARDGLPTSVLLLAADVHADEAYRALAAGACGYLSKAATGEDIRHAILRCARGEIVLGAAAQRGIAQAIRTRAKHEGPAFTPRERQMLERLARGLSTPAIAQELHVSRATVKTHLNHLYEKLEVSDRAAAVAVGMRRGLLE